MKPKAGSFLPREVYLHIETRLTEHNKTSHLKSNGKKKKEVPLAKEGGLIFLNNLGRHNDGWEVKLEPSAAWQPQILRKLGSLSSVQPKRSSSSAGPSWCNVAALVKDASYCPMLFRERTSGLSCNTAGWVQSDLPGVARKTWGILNTWGEPSPPSTLGMVRQTDQKFLNGFGDEGLLKCIN